MSSTTTWHNQDPGKIIGEDNEGGKSGRKIRNENQGEQSRRTTREDNQEPEKKIRNLGSIRLATHEGHANHLKGEERYFSKNKTGSHETKPHCNPYADSDGTRQDEQRSKDHLKIWLKKVLIFHLIHWHMLPPTYHFQVYKNTADLSNLLCSYPPTTSCSLLPSVHIFCCAPTAIFNFIPL